MRQCLICKAPSNRSSTTMWLFCRRCCKRWSLAARLERLAVHQAGHAQLHTEPRLVVRWVSGDDEHVVAIGPVHVPSVGMMLMLSLANGRMLFADEAPHFEITWEASRS